MDFALVSSPMAARAPNVILKLCVKKFDENALDEFPLLSKDAKLRKNSVVESSLAGREYLNQIEKYETYTWPSAAVDSLPVIIIKPTSHNFIYNKVQSIAGPHYVSHIVIQAEIQDEKGQQYLLKSKASLPMAEERQSLMGRVFDVSRYPTVDSLCSLKIENWEVEDLAENPLPMDNSANVEMREHLISKLNSEPEYHPYKLLVSEYDRYSLQDHGVSTDYNCFQTQKGPYKTEEGVNIALLKAQLREYFITIRELELRNARLRHVKIKPMDIRHVEVDSLSELKTMLKEARKVILNLTNENFRLRSNGKSGKSVSDDQFIIIGGSLTESNEEE